MIEEGQIVLFRFPQSDLRRSKIRPALIVRQLPGNYDDWLLCMISSRLFQSTEIDEMIGPEDDDFTTSGLKTPSLIRISRLAVVDARVLEGAIGQISKERLNRIRVKIAAWILGEQPVGAEGQTATDPRM